MATTLTRFAAIKERRENLTCWLTDFDRIAEVQRSKGNDLEIRCKVYAMNGEILENVQREKCKLVTCSDPLVNDTEALRLDWDTIGTDPMLEGVVDYWRKGHEICFRYDKEYPNAVSRLKIFLQNNDIEYDVNLRIIYRDQDGNLSYFSRGFHRQFRQLLDNGHLSPLRQLLTPWQHLFRDERRSSHCLSVLQRALRSDYEYIARKLFPHTSIIDIANSAEQGLSDINMDLDWNMIIDDTIVPPATKDRESNGERFEVFLQIDSASLLRR